MLLNCIKFDDCSRISTFYAYQMVCILHIPECLHSMHTRISAFYTYPNVCILRIPECLHSTQTRISVFHANSIFPIVCIPCLTRMFDRAFYNVRFGVLFTNEMSFDGGACLCCDPVSACTMMGRATHAALRATSRHASWRRG